MAKNGGARPGAGRPKGSKNRLAFRDYWSEKEIKEYVDFTKETYMADGKTHTWVGDQLFGKAAQALELSGKDGGPIEITGVEISVRKT
jgi:hypothetical protein